MPSLLCFYETDCLSPTNSLCSVLVSPSCHFCRLARAPSTLQMMYRRFCPVRRRP